MQRVLLWIDRLNAYIGQAFGWSILEGIRKGEREEVARAGLGEPLPLPQT